MKSTKVVDFHCKYYRGSRLDIGGLNFIGFKNGLLMTFVDKRFDMKKVMDKINNVEIIKIEKDTLKNLVDEGELYGELSESFVENKALIFWK